MRVNRLINVLSEITLIEMMVTIGLGVRLSDVLRTSRNCGAGLVRCTGKQYSCPIGCSWITPVVPCQPHDHYIHLADLISYLQVHQLAGDLYSDADAWTRTAILNVAGSGKFSSDRTIAQYAAEIWKVKPCPVS